MSAAESPAEPIADLDLSLIDAIKARHPKMECHWRTRYNDDRWEAQCTAGFADWIMPLWGGNGSTEQTALDHAAGSAHYYWVQWKRHLPGDPES